MAYEACRDVMEALRAKYSGPLQVLPPAAPACLPACLPLLLKTEPVARLCTCRPLLRVWLLVHPAALLPGFSHGPSHCPLPTPDCPCLASPCPLSGRCLATAWQS